MKLMGNFRRPRAKTTDGVRLYAIGDIHGCFDLLVELLQRIESDGQSRPAAETRLILLGDYVDRGPKSAQVCELLHSMRGASRVLCLRGNHDMALVEAVGGSRESLRFWLQYGGADTLESWGIDPALAEQAQMRESAEGELIEAMQRKIPGDMLEWLGTLPTFYSVGDYLFVHAGIRPKVRLEEQSDDDLMWIREPFLSSRVRHPQMVIHGHSEGEEPQVRPNRIGIDTAAYRTGVLTAIGIEEGEHWFVQTG